jgi:hypothetical protein
MLVQRATQRCIHHYSVCGAMERSSGNRGRSHSPNHSSKRKMDRSLSSSETTRYRPSVAEPYVKITKNISSAFTAAFALSSNANTLDDRYFGSLEEDEQPPFLKGIDSFHDMGKSDDIINSLVLIKECFFINKRRNNFIPATRAMECLGDLAKDTLNEILLNKDEDNPKFILRDLNKYRKYENNPVLSFLWFLRDVK